MSRGPDRHRIGEHQGAARRRPTAEAATAESGTAEAATAEAPTAEAATADLQPSTATGSGWGFRSVTESDQAPCAGCRLNVTGN